MLTSLGPDIWETHQPLRIAGVIPLGHRMTVLRLPSGGLLAHSPVRLDDDLAAELTYLGELEIVIAPSHFSRQLPAPLVLSLPGGQVLLRSRYADDDSWGHLHS